MDELIPDDYLEDPDMDGLRAEDFEALAKATIADWYLAKYPHLRQPYDPWIRREGETTP